MQDVIKIQNFLLTFMDFNQPVKTEQISIV